MTTDDTTMCWFTYLLWLFAMCSCLPQTGKINTGEAGSRQKRERENERNLETDDASWRSREEKKVAIERVNREAR